jgi:hypothetical protein
MAGIPAVRDGIQPGDIVVRAGLIMGTSKIGLSVLINEPYNHGGIALDENTVHHVESNGYEDISMTQFFADGSGGAVLRFKGLNEIDIRKKVAEIAASRRYVKRIGNPFSTAVDNYVAKKDDTVNCMEFIHNVFLQAIREVIIDKINAGDVEDAVKKIDAYCAYTDGLREALEECGDDPNKINSVLNYYLNTGINYIVNPRVLRFDGMDPKAVKAAEIIGKSEVNNDSEVKVKFEGECTYEPIVPPPPKDAPWYRKLAWYFLIGRREGWVWRIKLVAFTPNCFINSPSFEVVGRS